MDRETKHIFTWKIENFRISTLKNGRFLSSPAFMAESLGGITWFVELYPNGCLVSTTEFISCYLHRSYDCPGPDEVEYYFTLEAIDESNKSLIKFNFSSKFKKSKSLGLEEFLEKDTGFSLDPLTIRVTLKKRLPKTFSQNNLWTELATDHYSLKWNVKNFISTSADTKPISFSENLQFEIALGIPEDDVEISIRRMKGFTKSEKMLCKVTLLDLEGKGADSKEAILAADDPDGTDTWKFPNFLKSSKITSEKDKYLEENLFTLKFDFTLSSGNAFQTLKDVESKSLDNVLNAKEEHSAALKSDLMRVFANQDHTDVELRAGDRVIRAHKVILCARSPVFLAMFNQDMVENQSNAINISDVDAETLNSLLEYMYSGDIDIPNFESALKLLLAANKYQVLSLKEQCSSHLELLVSDENVCDILFTADLIQQQSLKVCAMNHIKENFKKVFKSDEWIQLTEKNLKLATETVIEVTTLLSV